MNKRVKKILIFIITVSCIAIAVLLAKINSRLPENPVSHVGNSAGNLYNRGLFTEDENYIYFANLADNYRLYRTTHSLEETICIHKDSVEYLNLDAFSSYLYYSRINYRQNTYGNTVFDILGTGIYRFHLGNKSLTRLYPDACGFVLLGGNSLFYQSYGEDGNFDLNSLDIHKEAATSQLLTTDYIHPVNYRDGLLYYSGVTKDHGLYTLAPETGSSRRIAAIDCFQPIVTDTGTYFLSQQHNYALFYLPNTSDTAVLITNNRVSSYNISKDGRFLFYQVDDGRNNRLCRYNLTTGQESELISGDYKNLNTASDYLFFTDFAESICYCYDSSADTLFSFMPVSDIDTK